jgi:hypothetical protein
VAFSNTINPPYAFNAGLLLLWFDPIVQLWFQEQISLERASSLNSQISSGFTTVSLLVSSRFVSALGSPLPISQISSAVSARVNLPAANIYELSV